VRPNQLDHARLGLAISKKRIPTAVARNRLKRLIRERFRREQEMLSGFDVVILAQKDISYLNSKLINGSLSELWGRILKCEK
jgi:ribonuclease P protein component